MNSLLGQSSGGTATNMGLAAGVTKNTQEPTSISIATNVLEDETKKLRAIVEHLSERLGSILAHSTPATTKSVQQGMPSIVSCPLADMLAQQILHVAQSREILEELVSRIQL